MIPYSNTILFVFVLLVGCSDAFEYSPNQIHDNNSPKGLNEKNLGKLLAKEPGDTLTVVFAGDSQQFYDEVDLFVRKVNRLPDVDFVLIAGDISNYGLLQEFESIVGRLNKLRSPYFGVIGNHDVVANGEQIFRRMFGPLDYSFVYDSVKFVLHNTNSREFEDPNVPDIAWLAGELRPAPGIANLSPYRTCRHSTATLIPHSGKRIHLSSAVRPIFSFLSTGTFTGIRMAIPMGMAFATSPAIRLKAGILLC